VNGDLDAAAKRERTARHVLVVDDDARVRPLMVRVLREEGFVVEAAENVAAALELLGAREFDLLLCDRRLPDGNGCDLMRAALRLRPIRGIAVTGLAEEKDIADSRAAGFAEHLQKPVAVEVLLAAIERVLGGGPSRTGTPA
jgi:CheY-like chemotaxis protein